MGDKIDVGKLEAQRSPVITFHEDGEARPTRGCRDSLGRSRRRSESRDSIRSVRCRTQNTDATLPIGFRTLSFQVSTSRGLGDDAEKLKYSENKHNKVDAKGTDFEAVDEHAVELENLYHRYNTSPVQGLSSDAAALRLKRDGANVLPSRRQNYIKKLLRYVFGGFCSILWVGVIMYD